LNRDKLKRWIDLSRPRRLAIRRRFCSDKMARTLYGSKIGKKGVIGTELGTLAKQIREIKHGITNRIKFLAMRENVPADGINGIHRLSGFKIEEINCGAVELLHNEVLYPRTVIPA